jgi:hypothetical protein
MATVKLMSDFFVAPQKSAAAAEAAEAAAPAADEPIVLDEAPEAVAAARASPAAPSAPASAPAPVCLRRRRPHLALPATRGFRF